MAYLFSKKFCIFFQNFDGNIGFLNSPQIMQSIVPHLPKYVTNSHARKTAFFVQK